MISPAGDADGERPPETAARSPFVERGTEDFDPDFCPTPENTSTPRGMCDYAYQNTTNSQETGEARTALRPDQQANGDIPYSSNPAFMPASQESESSDDDNVDDASETLNSSGEESDDEDYEGDSDGSAHSSDKREPVSYQKKGYGGNTRQVVDGDDNDNDSDNDEDISNYYNNDLPKKRRRRRKSRKGNSVQFDDEEDDDENTTYFYDKEDLIVGNGIGEGGGEGESVEGGGGIDLYEPVKKSSTTKKGQSKWKGKGKAVENAPIMQDCDEEEISGFNHAEGGFENNLIPPVSSVNLGEVGASRMRTPSPSPSPPPPLPPTPPPVAKTRGKSAIKKQTQAQGALHVRLSLAMLNSVLQVLMLRPHLGRADNSPGR